MYDFKLIPGTTFDAEGGPPNAPYEPGAAFTSTRHGRYIIGSVGPHTSSSRWRYSVVPWGAPIRLNADNYVEVQLHGRWTLLHTLPNWRNDYLKDPAGARRELTTYYRDVVQGLRTTYALRTQDKLPAAWNGVLPETWIFNDFGQVAIKYFVDLNGNRKLDSKAGKGVKREELLSDFLHTTPGFELLTIFNRQLHRNVTMAPGESHGCVHMVPQVMQDWVKKGVLKVGAVLEIHEYAVTVVPRQYQRPAGSIGQEVHFFPGAKKIALYTVSALKG